MSWQKFTSDIEDTIIMAISYFTPYPTPISVRSGSFIFDQGKKINFKSYF